MRRLLQLLVVAAALATASFAQTERVVITQADLIRMAETGLPPSLIIKVIESADEVPVLQPADITDLAEKGVPVEALEAVVVRRRTANGAGAPAATSAASTQRRVTVTATLDQRRGMLGSFQRGSDAFPVYWGAAALDAGGAVLPIESCPKQPACWCVSETDEKTCAAPGETGWDSRFSCFQAAEMQPGENSDVFAINAPRGMAELRVYPFYMVQEKGGAIRMASWDGPGGSAYLSVEPSGSESYVAEVGLALSVGRNASTDLTLPVKRFASDGERPGLGGRITIKTLTMSTTPLPQSCQP